MAGILTLGVGIEVDSLQVREGSAVLRQKSLQNRLELCPELPSETAGELAAAKAGDSHERGSRLRCAVVNVAENRE
jgi:hypothetical protein